MGTDTWSGMGKTWDNAMNFSEMIANLTADIFGLTNKTAPFEYGSEEYKKVLQAFIDDRIKNGTESEKAILSRYKDYIIGFDGNNIILGNKDTGEQYGSLMTNIPWTNQRDGGIKEYGIKGSSMCQLTVLGGLFGDLGIIIPGTDDVEANRLLKLLVEQGGKKPSDIYNDQLESYKVLTGILTGSKNNIVIQHVARGDKWDDASTKALLDKGIPVATGSNTTGSGHVLLIIGYDDYTKEWIVHDPFGNKNLGYSQNNGGQNGVAVRYPYGSHNIFKNWRAYMKNK